MKYIIIPMIVIATVIYILYPLVNFALTMRIAARAALGV